VLEIIGVKMSNHLDLHSLLWIIKVSRRTLVNVDHLGLQPLQLVVYLTESYPVSCPWLSSSFAGKSPQYIVWEEFMPDLDQNHEQDAESTEQDNEKDVEHTE
jgi:hypothetical protein